MAAVGKPGEIKREDSQGECDGENEEDQARCRRSFRRRKSVQATEASEFVFYGPSAGVRAECEDKAAGKSLINV